MQGLGKTITALALILKTRGLQPELAEVEVCRRRDGSGREVAFYTGDKQLMLSEQMLLEHLCRCPHKVWGSLSQSESGAGSGSKVKASTEGNHVLCWEPAEVPVPVFHVCSAGQARKEGLMGGCSCSYWT